MKKFRVSKFNGLETEVWEIEAENKVEAMEHVLEEDDISIEEIGDQYNNKKTIAEMHNDGVKNQVLNVLSGEIAISKRLKKI